MNAIFSQLTMRRALATAIVLYLVILAGGLYPHLHQHNLKGGEEGCPACLLTRTLQNAIPSEQTISFIAEGGIKIPPPIQTSPAFVASSCHSGRAPPCSLNENQIS